MEVQALPQTRERWGRVFVLGPLKSLYPGLLRHWGMMKLGEASSRWRRSTLPNPRLFALGIQKNSQALQRMLKCPLLCHASKPRLDTLQKRYVPKKKRVHGSFPRWLSPPHLLRAMLSQCPHLYEEWRLLEAEHRPEVTGSSYLVSGPEDPCSTATEDSSPAAG